MPYRACDITTLKGSFAALIERVGGLKRAALVSRVSESTLSRYCDPAEPQKFMPADVIASLETDCRAPVVTGFLAGLQGSVLTPMQGPTGDTSRDFAEMAASAAATMADYAMALRDGTISEAERQDIVRDLDALLGNAGQLRRDLVGAAT